MRLAAFVLAAALVGGCSQDTPVGPQDPLPPPPIRVQIEPQGYTQGLEDQVAAALHVHAERKNWGGWEFVLRDVRIITGCRVKYAGPHRRRARGAEYVGHHRGYFVGLTCPGEAP